VFKRCLKGVSKVKRSIKREFGQKNEKIGEKGSYERT
jgi:hypothetical protein